MNELELKFEQLCKNYVVSLSVKFEQIKIIENKLIKNSWNADDINELYRIIHTIAGSSAMFNFDQLSKSAYELLSYLKSIDRNSVTEIELENILGFLEKVKQVYASSICTE